MTINVVNYSISSFSDLLEKFSEASKELIGQKLRSNYFQDYFASVGVQTIVVEEKYVDHDYLDDYSAFYVKCFHSYNRYCTRLHFFSNAFDSARFSGFLQDPASTFGEVLSASYCGFLVVRPLPRCIIGRTCLVPYEKAGGRRHFPTVIPCRANLFGLPLSVSTVPFQEQDTVTAACATSALWSTFQVTGAKFQHWLPSPVEITSSATHQMPLRSRVFPNTDGLTIEQMARAINSVGLESYYIDPSDPNTARAAIYAYVSSGIPGLLMFELTGERGGNRERIGFHATSITGYSIPTSGPCAPYGNTLLRSGRIDKLYTHDDQVGPHARMEFIGATAELTTSWGLGGLHSDVRAKPLALLFPLYNKIRLPFSLPLSDIFAFDDILQSIAGVASIPRMEWDLRLLTIADFRNDVMGWVNLAPDVREDLLTRSFPRFLWLATANDGLSRMIDLIFDATDITSGRYMLLIYIHDDPIETVVTTLRNMNSNISAAINNLYSKVDVNHL